MNRLKLALIDDDSLIHMMWKFAAEAKQHELFCFFSVEDFLLSNIAFETFTFVDFDLRSKKTGVQIIEDLNTLGYKNLYLTSGYSRDHLNLPSNIRLISKDFPENLLLQING